MLMDTVERHLAVFFAQLEPDHVTIIDWVMRQKLMVLTRFVFGRVPALPVGEATIRVKERRPSLPEYRLYWWEVLMGNQVDATGALFVPTESAKHKAKWVGTQGGTVAHQAQSLNWLSIVFWGVHSFIRCVRYSTPRSQ